MKRTIFLMLAVLLSALSASAYAFKVDGIAYNKNGDGKSVYVAYGGDYTGPVTIPERVTYDGATYSVTTIGDYAFSDCTGLTSVTIPSSVTSIGKSAFSGCTGLTSVTIPNSVTEIGWSAFEGCTALTSVTFNATNCKSPDRTYEAWFQDCPLTSLVIGNDVKSIPSCLAYYQTRLTTVTIPNSVISIGWYAFVGCTGLTSVTIPNSVTEIGDMAFEGCTGLKKIYSLNPVPPVIYEGTFETYHTDLFVPKGCYLKYKEAEYWKNFTFISEINVETGDIDGDGEINVGDVTALINKLLSAASFDDDVCDINGDDEVNVTDVTSLINMILE